LLSQNGGPAGSADALLRRIVGMAAALESFYKPELAAHDPRPQASRLDPREMVLKYPLSR
jgi:hypothetical protein